jgi:hypothetical protein
MIRPAAEQAVLSTDDGDGCDEQLKEPKERQPSRMASG